MAFLLGLIGTVILVALISTIGVVVFIGMAAYYLLFAAGAALYIAIGLILTGLDTGEGGAVVGGVVLLLVVLGLVAKFIKHVKENKPKPEEGS